MMYRIYQGGDSSAGMQALPVGKIIATKVLRKDNQGIRNKSDKSQEQAKQGANFLHSMLFPAAFLEAQPPYT